MAGKTLSAARAFACALALSSTALCPAARAAGDDARVVLKFVKATASSGPAAIFDPASCPACVSVQDPGYARDNARETLVDLKVPRRRTLDLTFKAPTGKVRRVVVQTGDVAFTQKGERLIVHLPPLVGDTVDAGDVHTFVVEPGMVLRFEHDDRARRAGEYANASADFLERRAADNLTFAQREVVRRLGLGAKVKREGLGVIMIMGFDTNYPHGHTDAPAHIHMHMRWPDAAGTQIGHYYLDRTGLLTHNAVGFQGLKAPGARFGRGETFTTIDRLGRGVYSLRITSEGWLSIAAVEGPSCLIRPVAAGFQSGAVVACDDAEPVEIQVRDDLEHGRLVVRTGLIEEVFSYDPDTGALLSAQEAPPTSAAGYPPQER
ncbi:hypothetical protein DDF62_22270 [Caulobacter radicis]|uniref:hypothetical protein n=1 Tax=Caulobacter radicis TaxID=2172650 RepID=UPI000D56C166|nr:hypothetical protein [Caulobacter radicis]PVM84460.1 hypothetical protein DDF62_22270 [Caulobacter radicis]